jgi:hypothetical protein
VEHGVFHHTGHRCLCLQSSTGDIAIEPCGLADRLRSAAVGQSEMEGVAAAEITEGHYGNTAARAGRQSVAGDDILISSLCHFINKIPTPAVQPQRSSSQEGKKARKKSLEQKKKQQGS